MDSLITVSAGPQFDDGTYVHTVKGIERKTITPKKGDQAGQKVDILEWKFDLNDLVTGEQITDFETGEPIVSRATSSMASGPKSKSSQFLVALLGADAVKPGNQFSQEDLIGAKALGTVVHDDNDYAKTESLSAMPRSARRTVQQQAAPAPAAAEPTAPVEDEGDDLPF